MYHVRLNLVMGLGSVDVTGGQSNQLWGWRLQGQAPSGEAARVLTAVMVVVTANSGRAMVS